jgi:hypothetical protein
MSAPLLLYSFTILSALIFPPINHVILIKHKNYKAIKDIHVNKSSQKIKANMNKAIYFH